MIANTHKNCMGTVSFDGKFDGMRKAQDFIVYPMQQGDEAQTAKIQSDTRIGTIDLQSGDVRLSPPRSGGSYNVHLLFAKPAGKLSSEELLILKAQIFASASGKAGSRAVYCDNSAAIEVFSI